MNILFQVEDEWLHDIHVQLSTFQAWHDMDLMSAQSWITTAAAYTVNTVMHIASLMQENEMPAHNNYGQLMC